MKRTNWFDRIFLPIDDNGRLPGIIERLDGTPARLTAKTSQLANDLRFELPNVRWSEKKEIGHLADLEPLWHERLYQILDNNPAMKVADLTNRKTHETPHDVKSFEQLINEFSEERQRLLVKLRSLNEEDLDKTSIHPRLGTPMKVIDLAWFVAEHDDHHIAQMTCLINSL